MINKPLYIDLYKTIKLFNFDKFWTKEQIELSMENLKKKNWEFKTKNSLKNIHIVKKNWNNSYILTNNWKVLYNNMTKRLYRRELYIKDYPTLLWWLIWWIVGATFTIIIWAIF